MLSYFGWGSKPTKENPETSNQTDQPQLSQQTQNDPTNSQPPSPQPQPKRQQRQPPPLNLKLLFGGMTFFAASVLLTRRAFRKRHLASIPGYYTGSIYHKPEVNGALDAFEALNLATINVVSFSMMGTGAVMYKLGINNLEEARSLVREVYSGGIFEQGEGGNPEEDAQAEKEVEAWVIETLGLKGYEEEKKKIQNKRLEEDASEQGKEK